MPGRHAPLSRLTAIRALRDHPALADVLPSLPPRALVRLYDAVGMNDAGGLMALTPPTLLARALDEALWTDHGTRTCFDPDVFIDWLEVWLGEGDSFAAEQLLAVDEDVLAACWGAVLQVRDSSVDGFHRWDYDDGEALDPGARDTLPDAASTIIDRFVVSADQEDDWDVVHAALLALWSHSPDTLLCLLERLTVDDSRLEGEEAGPRFHQDSIGAREQRRERAGFVPPAAARAFLARAEASTAAELMAMTEHDLETARHLRQLRGDGESHRDAATCPPPSDTPPSRDDAARPVAGTETDALWSLLAAAGIVDATPPAGLLAGPGAGAVPVLQRRLDALAASDPEGLTHAGLELAYLANVLMAIDLTPPPEGKEEAARDLAFATANLGIELLEARGGAADVGRPPGLVRAFLLAWRTLMELPQHLVRAFERALSAPDATRRLSEKRWLHEQMRESLDDLAQAVRGRDFEAARESIGLLSLALDTGACRAAAHVMSLPPRFPGLLEGGGKETARWIRSMDDLERLAALLRALVPKD